MMMRNPEDPEDDDNTVPRSPTVVAAIALGLIAVFGLVIWVIYSLIFPSP